MIQSFIEFVEEIFPSINPYVKDKVNESLEQFKNNHGSPNLLTIYPMGSLVQGDVISNLKFIKTDSEGNIGVHETFGMIISNTCDIENDDSIVIAPLYKLGDINVSEGTLNNMKANRTYSNIYIEEGSLSEYLVDLGEMTMFNKDFVSGLIESSESEIKATLSQFGYYFFLAKLSVHFLRPEDLDVKSNRAIEIA